MQAHEDSQSRERDTEEEHGIVFPPDAEDSECSDADESTDSDSESDFQSSSEETPPRPIATRSARSNKGVPPSRYQA